MRNLFQAILHNSDEKVALHQLIDRLSHLHKHYFLKNEISQAFADYCEQLQKPAYFYHASSISHLIYYTHELILEDHTIWLLLRPWVGSQEVWRLAADLASFELMPPRALLEVRDRYVNRYQPQLLEIDVAPFYESSPSISDPRNIGQGLAFLHRHLCSELLTDPDYWLTMLFDVLHRHECDGISLLINDQIPSGAELAQRVKQALTAISHYPAEEPYTTLHSTLQSLGFEPGWGYTAQRVRETLALLQRLITAPEPAILEAFVARIPAVFRVVLISIHGWVGQEGVLGRSETSGQVAYVLEQARSLDRQLREEMHLAGLDFLEIRPQVLILTRLIPNCEGTLCNQRYEKVEHTENAWILRVPFREFNPKITQNWISKFEIWPYLESFALDAEPDMLARLGGRPNLIIGNYSDGNLVAFLLARRLNVTYCTIAHSLEKPKHLFSNLYWQDLEDRYHFSAQFTADLISMNAADFIITSSYQEIIGTPDTMGQYESYKCFTMPQLYHVIDGIDLFSPKFNRVPPGVNELLFFPYSQLEKRDSGDRIRVHDLLFHRSDEHILGSLANPEKRPILAIASVNVIKNLTGLVTCFGENEALQAQCNLILITNKLYAEEAINTEEAEEIDRLHRLISQYQLQHHIRWVGRPLSTSDLSEAYRVVADHQGIFVHFARFEALGRVILEAMSSGLPTFATQFGGALEIIEDGKNGFLINPTDLEGTAGKLIQFLDRCQEEPHYWHQISNHAIQQIQDVYNWRSHTRQLLSLAKIYSFWNYVHHNYREALLRYVEALFHLIYKPRSELILEQHSRQ
jgi:sucrose synthase